MPTWAYNGQVYPRSPDLPVLFLKHQVENFTKL
jgi:hypothetical protein